MYVYMCARALVQIFDDLEAISRRNELPRSGPCDMDIEEFEGLLVDTDLDTAQVCVCACVIGCMCVCLCVCVEACVRGGPTVTTLDE